jgi:hypothetical protein
MQKVLDRLDDMNEAGVIKYDVYSELHDLISGADVVERSEYNRLKLGNDLLNSCSKAINKQYDELRSEIDKAIAEIQALQSKLDKNDLNDSRAIGYFGLAIEIIQRNIGE